jgi:alkylated DNA repair dioxygenase AlkB
MQKNLFDKEEVVEVYNFNTKGKLTYYPSFFSFKESNIYFEKFLHTIKWQQDSINIMGNFIKIPRLTSWFTETDKSYTYSGIRMSPNIFSEEIINIKNKIEKISSSSFNSVLFNQYRNGNDSVDWHSDDEKELDSNADIASVSFGFERDFQFKSTIQGAKLKNINLANGSLAIMKSPFQKYFVHRIPKRKMIKYPRINLTFRVLRKKD